MSDGNYELEKKWIDKAREILSSNDKMKK